MVFAWSRIEAFLVNHGPGFLSHWLIKRKLAKLVRYIRGEGV